MTNSDFRYPNEPAPSGGTRTEPYATTPHPTYGPAPSPTPPSRPWTGGRVMVLVLGSLLALFSLGLLAGGVTTLAIDQTQRDSAGYLTTRTVGFESDGYAIVGAGLEIDTSVPGWLQVRDFIGELQLTVEGAGDESIFVGIAQEDAAEAYLAELGYDEVSEIRGVDVTYIPHPGDDPASAPGEQDFWTTSTEGQGPQTLTFEPETGRWVVVAMNADGTSGVSVTASAAAEVPDLSWIAIILLVAGGAGLLLSALPIYLAARP
ncbi:MAG TPA: hypothetical protein VFZ37_19640 [Jiangellaceae bacterium]